MKYTYPCLRKVITVAFLTMTMLGGCVSYTKPDYNEAQFRIDVGLCGGSFTTSGGIQVDDERNLPAVNRCMARKGYTVTRY